MIKNLNNNHFLIIFMLFVLCMLYLKKQEAFQNFNRNAFNYNGLLNYNFEPYVYKEKTISELHIIVQNILDEINKKTRSNLQLGKSLSNYDNVNIEKMDKNTNRYLVDVFVDDIKEDFTLRLLIDFNFNKKTKEINVNKITKSNATRLDLNNNNSKNKFAVNGYNEDKIDFSKFENQTFQYRQPSMYKQDIMPLLFQEKKCNIKKKNNLKCWDCDGIRNQNPKQINCDNSLHKAVLLSVPEFNKNSYYKSDDNHWLFSPTNVNLAHNY